jgi:hypothetical protein
MSGWYVELAHISRNLTILRLSAVYRYMQGRGRSTTWLPGDDHT